MLLTEGQARTS